MSRTGSRVRPAEPGDLDRLLAIENASFRTDRLDRRAFRHAVRSPTILAHVASSPDGEVLGYVLVQIRRGSQLGWLTSVAVAPEAHGQGLGRMLVEAAESAARAAGRTHIRLEVREDNGPARKLYASLGYEPTALVADYYEDGAGAWRYEKMLGPRPQST